MCFFLKWKNYMPDNIETKALNEKINDLETQVKLITDEYEQYKRDSDIQKTAMEKNEKLLHSVVEAAAGKIGQDFFDNIVINLSEWLGAECVLIGRMTEDERIEAVPLLLDGKISHGFSYELAGSPCDITTRKGFCAFSEDVINLFPKDQILVDLNAEGYIGTALYNKAGEANGVICAVSRKKITIPPYANEILKIIGARVSAEIERAKIEAALKESDVELRNANVTMKKFFSVLAHDLKNPFTAILGFSDYLKNYFSDISEEEKRVGINEINTSLHSLYLLVENLLNWSGTQTKGLNIFKENFSINDVVEENIDLFNQLAKKKKISISVKLNSSLNCFADKNMIKSVIRNLINNALKFTDDHGSIEIQGIEDNDQIFLAISDNGIGLTDEQINNLFRSEKLVSTKGTNLEKGSGLGLILVKEFIEKNDGQILIESEPGKGSTFTISLPKVKK